SDRPQGFPAISPCTITVTNGTQPIEGVEVTLTPTEVMNSIVISGKTDAAGKCLPVTRFAGHVEKGVPKGEFAVTLVKEPFVEGPSAEEKAKMTYDQAMAADRKREAAVAAAPRIIPVEYTQKEKTPAKLTVSEGKPAELAIDVSKK
ncbi:MAG: hypothetical protein Q4G59_02685, partial [Planctomycetia bacterium]|nr:hypothetical protein [Planctomycetia bacterium]